MGGASAASPRLEIARRSQWQTSSSNGLPAAAGSASRESHTKSLGFLALRGLFPRAISTRNSLWTTPNDEAGKATVRAHQRLRPPGRCVVQTKACMTNIRSTGAATVKRERESTASKRHSDAPYSQRLGHGQGHFLAGKWAQGFGRVSPSGGTRSRALGWGLCHWDGMRTWEDCMETKGSSARRWYLPACHQSQYVPTYLKSTWASVDAVPGQNGGRPGVAADKGDCPTPPSGTAAQSLRIRPGPGPGQQLLSCLQATLGRARIDGIQWAAQAAGCEYRDGTGTLWRCWPLPSCGRCHEVHWKLEVSVRAHAAAQATRTGAGHSGLPVLAPGHARPPGLPGCARSPHPVAAALEALPRGGGAPPPGPARHLTSRQQKTNTETLDEADTGGGAGGGAGGDVEDEEGRKFVDRCYGSSSSCQQMPPPSQRWPARHPTPGHKARSRSHRLRVPSSPQNSTASGGKLRRPPEFANLGMGFESCGRRAQNGQRQAVASWDAWHPYPAREHVLCLGSPVALVGPALRCVPSCPRAPASHLPSFKAAGCWLLDGAVRCGAAASGHQAINAQLGSSLLRFRPLIEPSMGSTCLPAGQTRPRRRTLRLRQSCHLPSAPRPPTRQRSAPGTSSPHLRHSEASPLGITSRSPGAQGRRRAKERHRRARHKNSTSRGPPRPSLEAHLASQTSHAFRPPPNKALRAVPVLVHPDSAPSHPIPSHPIPPHPSQRQAIRLHPTPIRIPSSHPPPKSPPPQNPQGASRHTPLHFAVHPVVVVVVTLLVRSALLRYFASYQSPPVCSTRQTTKTSSPPLKLTLSRCSTYIYLVPLPHAIAGSALDSSANYLDLLLPVQLERRFLLFFHSPSSSCRFFFVLGSRAYSLVPLPFWRAFRRYGYPEAVATSKTSLESDPTIDTCTRTTQPLPLADIAAERFDDEPCVVIASAFHTLASQPRSPGPGRYRAHHDMPFGRSPAMSIPGLDMRDDVPPPLPPPRILPFGDSPHPSEHTRRDSRDYNASSSFASGYGSMASSHADDRPSFKRRDTGSTANGDEGYASYASTDRSRDSVPTEFGLHHSKFHFQSPADIHTDNILKKLDPIRSAEKSPPRSLLTSSVSDLPRRHPDPRTRPTLNMPVQLPIHSRQAMLDSPASRFSDSPLYSAASPRPMPFHHSPVDQRLHPDTSDVDRSPRARTWRNNSDDATSTQGSYEFTGAEDMEMDDAASIKRLHLDDSYASVGQKRRAASPPPEEMLLHGVSGQSDAVRRRDIGSRGSPTPRLTVIPQGSSSSSMSPAAVSRSNSYISSASMPPLSGNSYGRRSPGGTSPGGLSPTSCSSPYTTPASLTQSPRTSISGRGGAHARTTSGASPRKLTEIQKPSGTKLQGFYMCECCPKKPKKFETAEELAAHEAEKQYECSFCGNRFKNKNEAERHQNSLHVRRHSWSCSALSGYDRAFHDSTSRPGEIDTCGYCGEEFPRTGCAMGSGIGGHPPRHATEQDWEERIRHLQDVHKFRECNSAKKFYRADHFRQHLKHSHAGTSGKWTNMLENACMVEEDPSPRTGTWQDMDGSAWRDGLVIRHSGEIRALRKPEAAGGWDSEPTCYAPLNRAGSGGEMLRLSEQFTNAPEECNNASMGRQVMFRPEGSAPESTVAANGVLGIVRGVGSTGLFLQFRFFHHGTNHQVPRWLCGCIWAEAATPAWPGHVAWQGCPSFAQFATAGGGTQLLSTPGGDGVRDDHSSSTFDNSMTDAMCSRLFHVSVTRGPRENACVRVLREEQRGAKPLGP
ncbi:hypothetical protein PCL_01435 [Purpureocillium lilacinum]|uniref:C2H2-type domain-containing protein n=1 Tax=Purpureocillium lilacinum TaxID=33203 RepID=A0A2U3E3H2_PURLI|nr:hypothetical protein PCL_01435 [Purpureocillium lilacinum]